MKLQPSRLRPNEQGSVLFAAIFFAVILGIAAASLLSMSQQRMTRSYGRWDFNESYFHADNLVNWAGQKIADNPDARGTFSVSHGDINLEYLGTLSGYSGFQDAWVTIELESGKGARDYLVTVSAKVNAKVRTLQASLSKDAPSKVFDYEYFLNNWGWWWGSSITGVGDNRANWDFDFRGSPTVNGSVMASGEVDSGGVPINILGGSVPINGLAGTDPVTYLHSGTERLAMPNLRDFGYYQSMAQTKGGTLSQGGTVLVTAYNPSTNKPGMYLVGTPANPIVISGPVVIPGDVVIKGTVTGIGTLYVGGNLYVAGDLTYANGPDFTTPPETMGANSRDSWVQNNVGKDLIAFAVREAIYGGAPNTSDWKAACYTPAGYGLANVGGEANLGADGVSGTPDDGVNYRDLNGDGTLDSAWYDADGDGVIDHNYNYDTDILLTPARAAKISNYPLDVDGSLKDFNSLSDNNFNTVSGIFYSNHAAAMRPAKNDFLWNGALVCRDEAIIFSRSCRFVYDSRVHSRYNDKPDKFVDLGLPPIRVKLTTVGEITPTTGFYAGHGVKAGY